MQENLVVSANLVQMVLTVVTFRLLKLLGGHAKFVQLVKLAHLALEDQKDYPVFQGEILPL